jgi:hypothetical protein
VEQVTQARPCSAKRIGPLDGGRAPADLIMESIRYRASKSNRRFFSFVSADEFPPRSARTPMTPMMKGMSVSFSRVYLDLCVVRTGPSQRGQTDNANSFYSHWFRLLASL